MVNALHSIRSVLLSVFVLLIGHGLQLTLFPLKALELGWSPSLIALMGSAYYGGFILGCLCVTRMIRRVGHIRVFATAVAMAAMMLLAAELLQLVALWFAARFAIGAVIAVLYTVVESWLNERSDSAHRGSVLSAYATISLGGIVVGQMLIEIDVPALDVFFGAAALLFIAAILPIGLTRAIQPEAPEDTRVDLGVAYRASRVGFVGAALAGIVVGLLWGAGAVFAIEVAGASDAGNRFVLVAIAAGAIAQFPAGRISDYVDRRWVILVLALIGIGGALLGLSAQRLSDLTLLYFAATAIGVGALPLYALCIAHANDSADGRFLAIASGMLMIHAAGSVAGPLAFAAFEQFGVPHAFALTLGIAFGGTLLYTLTGLVRREASREYFEPYQPLPKTTPTVAQLDPRDEEAEDEDASVALAVDFAASTTVSY
ncbi:MAG: MFS transporter [Pseudomonadota bacterium]